MELVDYKVRILTRTYNRRHHPRCHHHKRRLWQLGEPWGVSENIIRGFVECHRDSIEYGLMKMGE